MAARTGTSPWWVVIGVALVFGGLLYTAEMPGANQDATMWGLIAFTVAMFLLPVAYFIRWALKSGSKHQQPPQ